MKNSTYLIIICLLYPLLIIHFSCTGSAKWEEEILWREIDFKNLPAQSEYPDAEAIVLLDEGTVEIQFISDHSFSTYERHTITRIFNTRGYHYANIVIPYGSRSNVDEIEARTISPDGKITVLDPETIFDVNLYPNFVFYSDQRAKIFTLPSIEDGCIIEYRYLLSIRSQTYGSFWRFQSTIPVNISRFTLTKPAEWELDYRLYDISMEPETRLSSNGEKKSLVWDARNLEPIKKELAMPPVNDLGARLALRPVGVDSWQDIAQWYHELVETQIDLSPEIENRVDQLIKGAVSEREKLQRIFEWIRDQIRYVAVSIGMGGYQPHPVAEIMRNKYGDCKDMTTLLCAMADRAGIEVNQALISTRLNGIADTTLPAAVHFNHVIAYAPGVGTDGIWMDATEKTAAFGQLPWYDQGVPTLLINSEGLGKIKMTPASDNGINRSMMTWDIKLDHKGAAVINGKIEAFGTVANEMREKLYLSSEQEIRNWLQFYLSERAGSARLMRFNIGGLSPVTDSLIINFLFESKHFARRIGQDLVILPGDITYFDLADYLRTSHRENDIHLQFASSRRIRLNLELPAGMNVYASSCADSVISQFGKYLRRCEVSGQNLRLLYNYELNMKMIPASKYVEFQEFLDKISEYDFNEIAIKPSETGS